MKKLRTFIASFAVLVFCAIGYNVQANTPASSLGHRVKLNALNAAPLNGAASTLTFTIDTRKYAYGTVTFWMFFDYTANAGQISLTCTGGPSASDNGYTLTVCSSSSPAGECVAVNSGIMRSVAGLAADTYWDHRLEVVGARSLECVVSHGGTPGATDKITVHYTVTEL